MTNPSASLFGKTSAKRIMQIHLLVWGAKGSKTGLHSPAHLFNICAKNVIRLINVIKGQRTDFTALEISPNVFSFSQENNKLSAESNAHGTSFIAQVMTYRDLKKKAPVNKTLWPEFEPKTLITQSKGLTQPLSHWDLLFINMWKETSEIIRLLTILINV